MKYISIKKIFSQLSHVFKSDTVETTDITLSTPDDDIRSILNAQYETAQEHLKLILNNQRELQISCEQLRATTVMIGKTIRLATLTEGLSTLCDLWSLVNRSGNEQSDYYSDLLYQALCSFGLQPIRPEPGEQYNPVIHRKSNTAFPGTNISFCHKCDWGWKLDNTIIRKAIVEINEEVSDGQHN